MHTEYDTFELTEAHLRLMRHMWVGWQECEFGAPEIDPKRPYGNSDVYGDIAEILGIEGFTDSDEETHYSDEEKELMDRLHRETQTAIQVVLSTRSFELGTYRAEKYTSQYERWRG